MSRNMNAGTAAAAAVIVVAASAADAFVFNYNAQTTTTTTTTRNDGNGDGIDDDDLCYYYNGICTKARLGLEVNITKMKEVRGTAAAVGTTTTTTTTGVSDTTTTGNEDDKAKEYSITDALGPDDVICGRGSVAYNNGGNRRFRVLIGLNVDKYNNMHGRHRKGTFIRSLTYRITQKMGAKFYKVHKHKHNHNNTVTELTETQIRAKVGHALRDCSANEKLQLKQKKKRTTTMTCMTTK